jgi:DNA polymerase-3 subunit beta
LKRKVEITREAVKEQTYSARDSAVVSAVVNGSQLLAEITFVAGAAERRTTIPIIGAVLITAGENTIALAATNLDVTNRSSCDARTDGEASLAVGAVQLRSALKELIDGDRDAEVTLEFRSHDIPRVTLRCGDAEVSLNALAGEDFPTLPAVPSNGEFSLSLSGMKRMLGSVSYAITREETRFQLNGTLLEIKAGAMKAIATDGHRMAVVKARPSDAVTAPSDLMMLLPSVAMAQISNLSGLMLTFGKTSDMHFGFACDRRSVTARITDVKFPNYNEVIATDLTHRVQVSRRLLATALRKVTTVANTRTGAVRLTFKRNAIVANVSNAELGDARVTVEAQYDGKPFFCGFNVAYVAQFLAAVDADEVALYLRDENAQMRAVPLDDEGRDDYSYTYIVMPLRLS